MQCVADCDTDNPKTFEQPVIQTLQMFVGESGCWLVVFISWLLRRYGKGSKTAANGPAYQAVDTRDSDEEAVTPDEADDEAVADLSTSQTLVDPTNMVAKLPDDEAATKERVPLEGWRVTILALPAICDICGTTLMNAGLLFVAASIYQMTRGALVLFVGLFSVIFLKRHLGGWKWASLFIVVLGVAIVGLAGYLDRRGETSPTVPGDTQPGSGRDALIHNALLVGRGAVSAMQEHTAAETVLGVLMIAGAQIFTASQFVLEESIMAKYSIDPIRCVGWEGIFGFTVTLIGMGVLHGVIGTGYFNAREAFHEVFTNRAIAVSSLLIMISIG
jgi:drug/metabolite transporter (DMT)-like permease